MKLIKVFLVVSDMHPAIKDLLPTTIPDEISVATFSLIKEVSGVPVVSKKTKKGVVLLQQRAS